MSALKVKLGGWGGYDFLTISISIIYSNQIIKKYKLLKNVVIDLLQI